MKNLVFLAFFLGFAGGPRLALAQATPTSTFTPGCCQLAQTVTGGSGGPFTSVGYLTVNNAATTLYAADVTNNEVQMFSIPGLTPAGIITGFNQPFAMAMGADGYLYVGEYGGMMVRKIDLTSGAVTATMFTADPVLGVAVDTNGDVYASVAGLSAVKVQIFPYTAPNSYGTPVTINAPQISTSPRGLLKQGNKLYIADFSNSQVLELDQSGPTTAYNFGIPQTVVDASLLMNPNQITMDSLGNLYVASANNDEVVVLTGNTTAIPSIFTLHHSCTLPSFITQGVALDPTGNLYVGGNGLIKIDPCALFSYPQPTPSYQGSNPPGKGQAFLYPSPARDHATVCYSMAESGSVEIEIWNQNGEVVTEVTDRKFPGIQITPLNFSLLSPGVYFYVLVLKYDSGVVETLKPKKFAVIR